jgi:hypothetical protein
MNKANSKDMLSVKWVMSVPGLSTSNLILSRAHAPYFNILLEIATNNFNSTFSVIIMDGKYVNINFKS